MESFITLSIIGLLVGIVFSMPIWGPVSIFIATSGLQGRWIYCVSVALGSGIIDSLVCFIVILGFTKVMGVLSPFVPYLFLCGAAVLFIMGTRIIMTGIDPHRTGGAIKKRAINKNMAGFWAGAILNASNPSILFGWLSSSFLAISFAASMGFNVGGFDRSIGASMQTIKIFPMRLQPSPEKSKETVAIQRPTALQELFDKKKSTGGLPFFAGAGYAFSAGLGTFLWYSSFSYVLSRNRTRFSLGILKRIIQGLGVVLCVLGLFFYHGRQ